MFDRILEQYQTQLSTAGKSPVTQRAVRSNLTQFCTWWERTRQRAFDLTQVVERDLRAWKVFRQQDEGMAPATINRGLSTLRRLCAWAVEQRWLTETASLWRLRHSGSKVLLRRETIILSIRITISSIVPKVCRFYTNSRYFH